jgi:sugar phosphate isomerase/epimerase
MGVAATCYLTVARPNDTLAFLEQQARNGAGGIQMAITSFEPAYLKKLRARAESLGMFLELMGPLPQANGDDTQLRKIIAAGRELGAKCIRTRCLSGRRYETFDRLDKWQAFVDESKASLLRAASIVDKEKFPLAIENHKDWTAYEMTALMRQLSSEYFGVCLDTGNNISLLDGADETIDALLPYVITTHIKDMAVKECEDGFLMSEVVFGEGMLDIPGIVARIRKAKPKSNVLIEVITRDPLKIPCLTPKYWLTFGDRSGHLLAKSLRMIRQQGKASLPVISHLSRAEQARVEDENVRKCLDWAAAKLDS